MLWWYRLIKVQPQVVCAYHGLLHWIIWYPLPHTLLLNPLKLITAVCTYNFELLQEVTDWSMISWTYFPKTSHLWNVIPYSGKLLREKTFTNFKVLGLFAKAFSAKILFFSNSRKFSPLKDSHYMVEQVVHTVSVYPQTSTFSYSLFYLKNQINNYQQTTVCVNYDYVTGYNTAVIQFFVATSQQFCDLLSHNLLCTASST